VTDQPPASTPPGFGPPPPQYAPQPPQPPAPGPEFLAVDKHNSVVVDASGVAFEMYDITVDFPSARRSAASTTRRAPTARP
jgi:U5 snRNP spliceosome subunit